MWLRWVLDCDPITRSDLTTAQDNAHDSGLAHDLTLGVPPDHLDDGRVAELKQRAGG